MLTGLTLALAAVFLATGATKVAGHPVSLEMRDHLGVAPAQWRAIGLLELAGVAGALLGLWLAPLGIAAVAGLTLTALGAIGAHVRNGDPVLRAAPAAVTLALAGATLVAAVS